MNMVNLLLFTIFAASPITPQETLAQCERRARDNPNDYDSLICLNQLEFQDPLEIIDQIERAHPEGIYFALLRGNHHWNHGDPTKAVSAYVEARSQLISHGDELRAIVAQSNLAKLLLWRTEQSERTEREIQTLGEMYRLAKDPLARRKGLILWAGLCADQDKHIGQAYAAVSGISPDEIQSMDYAEQRSFFHTRGRLAGLMLRFKAANRDFLTLAELALEQDPPEYTRQAVALAESISLEMRGLQLQPQALKRRSKPLEQAILRSIQAATRADRTDLVGSGLYELATIYTGTGRPKHQTLALLDRCLALKEASRPINIAHAQCLDAKSRVIETENPKLAMELAQRSLKMVDKKNLQELRLNAWRNVLRRAWTALPRQEALVVAARALDQIEGLRSHQRDKSARQLMFAVWTEDYAWLASRLFELSKQEPAYLHQALSVLERSRARVLLEYMPEPSAQAIDQMPLPPSNSYATLPKIQEKLEADEAMLVYQIANNRALNGEIIGGSWVLVVTRDQVEPIKLDVERFELADSVSIIRDMARYDDDAMHLAVDGVAKTLLAPATSTLPPEVQNLIIVADGPLHALPFFSIDPNYNYSLTPSATIWSKTRLAKAALKLEPAGVSIVDPKRTAVTQKPPSFAPGMTVRDAGIDVTQPLHEGRRESQAMQDALSPDLRTLAGTDATAEQLVKQWKTTDNLLHISAHSQVNTELPEQSRILLSNVRQQDQGHLTASEIYKLPLDHDVVVLAGCSTGWGNWVAGEGILSLARAFQIAGASAVVASLWPIRDREAADFFEEFYARLGEGHPIAKALSGAQKALRDRDYPPQAYEGYIVIGDGRIQFNRQASTIPWRPWLFLLFALIPAGLTLVLKKRPSKVG